MISLFLPTADASGHDCGFSATNTVPTSDGETVLVVEDNPDVGRLTERMLKELGYAVLGASNAADALRLLRETGPVDLILSDIGLPGGVDGIAFAEEAARVNPGARIGFMSGNPKKNLSDARSDAAESQLLHKPFGIRELSVFIKRLLVQV